MKRFFKIELFGKENPVKFLPQRLAVVLVSLFTALSTYSYDFYVDGIYYNVKSFTELTCMVTNDGYRNTYRGNIVIPATINYLNKTLTVVGIESGAFSSCPSLTSITIPNTVNKIEDSSFKGCTKLESITIEDGESVLLIDNYNYTTFSECPIVTLYIGRNISSSVFSNMRTLNNVTIGNLVTEIPYMAFSGCTGLESITIGNSVITIGNYAFSGCTALASIEFPSNSIKEIGSKTFSGCTGLKKVIVKDIAAWCGISFGYVESNIKTNNPLYYAHHLYSDEETEIKDLVIPDTATKIGYCAFYGCTDLESVTIGNSVTQIGNYAFYGCNSLKSVTIGNSVKEIVGSAFSNCNGLKKVIVKNIAAWCGISFGYNYQNPLYYAKHLYSDEDTEITDLVIPNTVTSIGKNVFVDCTGLESVTIGNSVTKIGDYAFQDCNSLGSVTIGNSVTEIGFLAFSECSGLTNVTIQDSYKKLDCSSVFSSANVVEKLYLGRNINTGNRTESLFPKLTTLTISNYVTEIGKYMFRNCSDLESVTIGNYVTTIGDYAFSGCSSLTGIAIPNSVTKIGNYAFQGCTTLASIVIPNSVTSIGSYALQNCTSLTNVTISSMITSINTYTFDGCSRLKTLYSLNTTPPSISSYNFTNNHYMTVNVLVPQEALYAYQKANIWKNFWNLQGFEYINTGIETVKGDAINGNNVYYDLNGNRLDAPKKGLNIINGKKVIIK